MQCIAIMRAIICGVVQLCGVIQSCAVSCRYANGCGVRPGQHSVRSDLL